MSEQPQEQQEQQEQENTAPAVQGQELAEGETQDEALNGTPEGEAGEESNA